MCFIPMSNFLCPSAYILLVASNSHFAPSSDVMFFRSKVGEGTKLSLLSRNLFWNVTFLQLMIRRWKM
jgi:hypothetical protein